MREFDDIIRRKLEQLPVEGTPDWKALETQLEGDSFDSMLRNQLNATTNAAGADKVTPAILGWDALSAKLDIAAEVEGDVFDRILAQKLTNPETELEPQASWKVLSHRMDTLWPLRKVLVRYRVMEIAAAVALLLTFAPLLRDNPISTFSSSTTASASATLTPLLQKELSKQFSEGEQFLAPEEIAELVYSNEQRSALNGLSASASEESQEELSSNTSSLYSPFALLKAVFNWAKPSSASSNADLSLISGAERTDRLTQTVPVSTVVSSTSDPIRPEFTQASASDLKLLALEESTLLPLAMSQHKVPSISVASPESSKWEIGPQAGYLGWNIRTPADMEFELQANSRWRGEGMLGMTAVRKLGKRTSLGLGATFARLTYDPELPVVFDEADVNTRFSSAQPLSERFDRTESFDGITVNLAQVPVDFRVQLNSPEKRFDLVAFVGLAANVNLSSNYDLKTSFGTPLSLPTTAPPSELEQVPTVIANERTPSEVKEFLPGVLEGGSLAGNTFLSARLGLESSIELNNRISAFSNLSYNHFLPLDGGFGPNKDKLNAVGLTLGARVSL